MHSLQQKSAGVWILILLPGICHYISFKVACFFANAQCPIVIPCSMLNTNLLPSSIINEHESTPTMTMHWLHLFASCSIVLIPLCSLNPLNWSGGAFSAYPTVVMRVISQCMCLPILCDIIAYIVCGLRQSRNALFCDRYIYHLHLYWGNRIISWRWIMCVLFPVWEKELLHRAS